MTQPSLLTESVPERSIPAWVFSIFFHSSVIIFLGLVIQPLQPSGGFGAEKGIVIETGSAGGGSTPGGLYDGEEESAASENPAEQIAQADLLAALPTETAAASVAASQSRLISEPSAQENARPEATQTSATTGDGQPNTGQPGKGSGGNGLGSGHGYARVSVFGVQGEGNKFIYLFDRSSSMEGRPLSAAKRQLLDSLKALDTIHQFHIIFFNTQTQSFDITEGGRRIAFATDRNKQLAEKFVGGITAEGGTDRVMALKTAIKFAPDVIFFLTDADDPMSPAELAEIAEANYRSQAQICVIEFGRRESSSSDNFLVQLARQSGGQYGYVNTTELR